MFTRCSVLDFTCLETASITAVDLEKKEAALAGSGPVFAENRSVLLKTKNSLQDQFDFSFVYLEKSGAAYLAQKKVRGVGIDALGIERDQPDHETHKTLLGAEIWIIEGLRLGDVPEGSYILAVMPLKVKSVEALPVRAALLDRDSMPAL
jgi:kynurenine formamidase